MMNRVIINGEAFEYPGNNLVIKNGKVIVDGTVIHRCDGCDINVVVYGSVNQLQCNGSAKIYGDVGNIDCGGSCTVNGNVEGNIQANGSVVCNTVVN